ncbi:MULTISPECIES: hypothetical protein [Thalassolituus]|jgi:hypothetical protein|uniref:hypothetical protein n=1 Tax=Thalassolituus TaxID=187492 RepID=UPI0026473308|nr:MULTISPECIES: hypothetical protein [Thalassolituus]|tara:strand:+ start:12464 stop:13378 length:915 start_codon:yes stop_codon:yes gene_type:complete
MTDFPTGRCGIVAHDAGAANQILHWITAGDFSGIDITLSLHGPAQTIAERLGLLSLFDSIDDVETLIQKADWVICGTGWATQIEKSAMCLARQYAVPVFAVLDHWVNYRPRLNYQADDTADVDELWVVDEEARSLAATEFPGTCIRAMPGRYLESQIADIGLPSTPEQVLFLMEPVREQWGDMHTGQSASLKPGEFSAFEFFLTALKKTDANVGDIVIRPHPSDPPGKYDALTECVDFRVSVKTEESLSHAISEATYVVGLNSYAMVVALAAGRKVYCALPPIAPACVLPHAGIIDLRNESFSV